MPKVSCEQPNNLSWCYLTLPLDVLNVWKTRYAIKWVYLRSLKIQVFLEHSSIANLYQDLILSHITWKNFLKIYIFFCKRVLTSAVTWLPRVSPSNYALEQTKEHLHQVVCFFSVLKYHTFFFQRQITEQAKFVYSPLGKEFEKQTEKKVGAIKSLDLSNKKRWIKKNWEYISIKFDKRS